MKARNRRSGFEVTAIAMPARFFFGSVEHPAGSVVVHGPKGGKRVYDPETFERLYEVTAQDAPLEDPR